MRMSDLPPPPFGQLPAALRRAWRQVAALPFENLTKILKVTDGGEKGARPIRLPDEVLRDHRQYGTGATCFALVFLLRHLARQAGIELTLHTCDRRHGDDTHAAAAWSGGGRRWIFDPGYHIVQPLPGEGEERFYHRANPNATRIRRRGEDRYECYTGHAGNWRLRFVFKDRALSDSAFRRTWVASFSAEMMAYPVLTRFRDGRMIYLQKSNLVIRDASGSQLAPLRTGELADAIPEAYGIDARIVKRALERLRRK